MSHGSNESQFWMGHMVHGSLPVVTASLIFAVLHQRLYIIKWIACSFFIYNHVYSRDVEW